MWRAVLHNPAHSSLCTAEVSGTHGKCIMHVVQSVARLYIS